MDMKGKPQGHWNFVPDYGYLVWPFRFFAVSDYATKHEQLVSELPLLQRDRYCSCSSDDFFLYYASTHRRFWELNDSYDASGP